MQDTTAKIRHYESSWDRKMFHWNMESKVFETLVKTTEEHIPSLHKYYDLKRRVLGLKELTSYDLALEISKSEREYKIPEAQKIILKAVSLSSTPSSTASIYDFITVRGVLKS